MMGVILNVAAPTLALTPDMQMTGYAFSEVCTRPDESWISFCNGYVQSVVDSFQSGSGICIPAGTTRTDIVTRVEKAITASANMRRQNAYDAVRLSIEQAYQCAR